MKQRACPVAGARASNEQRPMECSGARSAGGEHPWSQLCFIKRQRSRESQRTLTGVPPQSCPRRSQDVAFGLSGSAHRALPERPPAEGVDGRRRRRRGTPFGSGKKCRFFPDFVSRPRGTTLDLCQLQSYFTRLQCHVGHSHCQLTARLLTESEPSRLTPSPNSRRALPRFLCSVIFFSV